MIELEEIKETRTVAQNKWREYRDAVKKSRNNDYRDLAKVYDGRAGKPLALAWVIHL